MLLIVMIMSLYVVISGFKADSPLRMVGGFVVYIIAWCLHMQNKLVDADEECGNATSQIGVHQISRWDALQSLADLVGSYNQHERDTLLAAIAERTAISNKTSAQEIDWQENMLTSSFSRVNALAETYPDLKSNTTFLDIMRSVRDYENSVRESRINYNNKVTAYNGLVRSMPGSLIAAHLKFKLRGYLQDDPRRELMPTFQAGPSSADSARMK